jgi:hypothetical protein
MDLSKPGPLYDVLRDKLGIDDTLNHVHDRLAKCEGAIGSQVVVVGRIENGLADLEDTVEGLERRTNSAGLEDRLKAIEDRLTLLAKVKARPVKPVASSRAKPAAKGAKGS